MTSQIGTGIVNMGVPSIVNMGAPSNICGAMVNDG